MKIKVARKGLVIGEFQLWEVFEKWTAGEISMTDDYWRDGMSTWGKLQDIKEEIITAKRPPTSQATSNPPPPLPAANRSSRPEDNPSGGSSLAGTIIFIIGALTLLSGLFSDATGSAIRQGVLAQHMTNGILLMILGKLIAAR
jgi:hypothetical protein